MDTKLKSTPTPWFQDHREDTGGMYNTEIFDAKGVTIATLTWYPVKEKNGDISTAREANAALIVRAVNTHAELIEALKECADDLEAEIEARYQDIKDNPAITKRYERDMEPVVCARKAIALAERGA